jgi:hypothetical protein
VIVFKRALPGGGAAYSRGGVVVAIEEEYVAAVDAPANTDDERWARVLAAERLGRTPRHQETEGERP